jgi:tetratricopeptide (TPR) repeat protein
VRILIVKGILNSEERVVLHLSSYKEQNKKYDLPEALTRKGIAHATGMGLSHASRQITNLKNKKSLTTVRGRGKGKTRNQDFHFLNTKGKKYAQAIEKKMKKTKIEIRGFNDSPLKLRIVDVPDFLKDTKFSKISMLDICKFTSEEKVLELSDLDKVIKERFTYHTENVPNITHFFGRVKEINQLKNWIAEKDKHNIIFIHGMAGIGKTTLAAKLLEDFRSSSHLFWYDFREMDTLRGMLFKLAGFLTELGNDHLELFLRTRTSYGYNEITQILERSMAKMNSILVFDDFQKSEDEIRKFFTYFLTMFSPSSQTKIMILSREIVPFYDSRDVISKEIVAELPLEGLDYESSKKLLGKKGKYKQKYKEIYGFTAGNPLFLEVFLSGGHVDRFVHDELFAKLKSAEKNVISQLSIYRYPVSEDFLRTFDDFDFESLYNLTRKSLVKRDAQDRYFIHDILKTFFYSQLNRSTRNKYHLLAANSYKKNKEATSILESIYHFQEANQHDIASNIAIDYGNKILDSGFSLEYIALLDRLDKGELRADAYGEILILMGNAHTVLGEWKKALKFFNEGIDFAKINNIEKVRIRALCESGHILEEQNELKKAKEFFQMGLNLSLGIEYTQGLSESYRGIGRIFWRNSKFKMAIDNYNKCVELCNKSGDLQILASAYIDLGNSFDEMYDIKKAVEYYKKSINILTKQDNPHELGRAYMNLAATQKHNKEFEKAIKNYKKHDELVKPIKAIKDLGYNYSGISFCYAKINDINMAKRFLKKAENIALKIENENIMYEVYHTYAQISRINNEHKEAVNYLNKSLAIVKKLDAQYYMAYTYFEIGLIFEEMGDKDSAKKHFNNATRLYRKLGLDKTNL